MILENVFRYNEDNYTLPEPSISRNGQIVLSRIQESNSRNSKELQKDNQSVKVEIQRKSKEYYQQFVRPENKLLYIVEDTTLNNIIGYINHVQSIARYILTATTEEPRNFKEAQQRLEAKI